MAAGSGLGPVRMRSLRRGVRAALLAVLASTLTACGAASPGARTSQASRASDPAATELYGLVPEPLPRKPDFTLTDTQGRPYNLLAATRGKLTFLYFGYTHCPNACPATMSDISAALRLEPPAIRRQVAVVFVTVDPRRDTLPVLRTWLDHYSATFVGLRGTPAQIASAEVATGLPPAPQEPETGNYTVPHSSILFAYSPDDRSHVIYSQGFTPADYAHDMPLLLRFRGRGG